jgi:adenosylmethionine-8-amino-7-oxononanoate aminotransferase
MFACEHAGVRPDIICLSKALTAGYLPLGATVVTEAIYEAFLSEDHGKTFFHGHSYTGSALACAVAIASLRLFEEEDVMGRVLRIETQLREGFSELRGLPAVGDVRVIGGVAAVELVPASGTGGYLEKIGARVAATLLDRGLFVRPLGNVLYLMPPYVISSSELDWAISEMADAIAVSTGA